MAPKRLPSGRLLVDDRRKHVTAGNTCQDCHGKVAETERLAPAGNLNMGGCMNCHQARNASIDCTFCHDPQ